jgi:cytochrome c nitrite reductase small subunit
MNALRKLLKPASLAAIVGIPLGVGAYTTDYAEATSYLTNDPRACVNCHVMRDHYDGWQKASHHAAASCNDCHVPVDFLGKYWTKLEHGWRHSKGFTLQDFHEPIRIHPSSRAVVEANCVRCHGELVSELSGHALAHGETTQCLHCHTDVGHGPRR